MAAPTDTPLPSSIQWQFRSSLNTSEELGTIADATSLAAFSPDIIPLDQIQVAPAELRTSYNNFVAHSIDRDETQTLVYIRAKATLPDNDSSSESCRVDLYAVPNELILWPQVWQNATAVGHTELATNATISPPNVAVGDPIPYKPIALPTTGQHSHETLVAVRASSDKPVASKVNNWRDLVQYVGKNDSLAFYNVTTADPRPQRVTLTTKLQLLENEASFVDLYLGLETVGVPTKGIEASLHVADNLSTSFTIGRQAIDPTKEFGQPLRLPAGFNGTVTLEVFNDNNEIFDEYSSISIVLYAVNNLGSDASSHILLGAEHVFFDHNPRVKQLIRKYSPSFLRADTSQTATTPEFYFRDKLGDTSAFPRSGISSNSPDIQPMGKQPLLNPAVQLSDENTDYSSAAASCITVGGNNYIYMRAHTTSPHAGEVRLYMVPNSVLLHPSQIDGSYIVPPNGVPGNTSVPYDAVLDTLQQHIFDVPFVVVDAPALPAGNVHYCLIGECKPSLTEKEKEEGLPPYKWPHEDATAIVTASEFVTWVNSEPCVSQRNMCYQSGSGGGPSWCQRGTFLFPGSFSNADQWTYTVEVDAPIGSAYSLDSTEPQIQITQTVVKGSPEKQSVSFTGKGPGFLCQTALTWYSNGLPIPSGGVKLISTLSLCKPATSITGAFFSAQKKDVVTKGTQQKLHVYGSYPNIIVPSEARVPGRLKVGGAIRARGLLSEPVVTEGADVCIQVGADQMEIL